jgi:hypothetical protein
MSSFQAVRRIWEAVVGVRYGGLRNYYETFGYQNRITWDEANRKYKRQDVASRVVDAPADAIWDSPPIITSNNQEWNDVWSDLITNHYLWQVCSRLDKIAGMDPYAVLLIGIDDGGVLSSSLGGGRGRGRPPADGGMRRVIYLQPYHSEVAKIQELVTDPTDADYMRPQRYQINFSAGINQGEAVQGVGKIIGSTQGSRTGLQSQDVHASRVIHVVEGALTNELFGNPRLHKVFNLLDDLMKVAGGSAETFWLTANRGLQIDVDKDMKLSPNDENDLSDEIDEYLNNMRRVIRTRGVSVKPLGSDITDPKGNFEVLISLISGATGIPNRILIGSEAGQLASAQDRANWAERIQERRTHFAEPQIIWPLIRRLTSMKVLPTPENLQITVTWPEAFKLSPLERAQTAAQRARSAANLWKLFMQQRDNGGTAADIGLLSIEEARSFMELIKTIPVTTDTTDVALKP